MLLDTAAFDLLYDHKLSTRLQKHCGSTIQGPHAVNGYFWFQAQALQGPAATNEQHPLQPLTVSCSWALKLLQKLNEQLLHGFLVTAEGN